MKIVERKFTPSQALKLVKEGVSGPLARILASRGVRSIADERKGLSSLLPYTGLKGVQEMATVLADALIAKQRLLIVADYDADGATACTVAMRALSAFGGNVGYLIPNRLEHGYGLTPEIVDIAVSSTPRPAYLITVDNGIASHAGIAHANAHGVPVLVTDHHLPTDTPPAALAIVNPSQHGCLFESKNLAGCGVIFYVMWALQDELVSRGYEGLPSDFDVFDLLPIVALGTIADVVRLDENNRILVREGLARIREGKSFPGIEALAKVASRECATLTASDVAFGLGPRINAAGRLQSMDAGVECLLCEDLARATEIAGELNSINERRKDIESDIVDEAVRRLVTDIKMERFTAVLHSDEWHQGVIGIVAGRLKEKVWRPTFILTSTDSGELKGSGRSIPGFHLRDALDMVDKRVPGVLVKFGGHAMAAGVTIRNGGLNAFAEAFEAVAKELLTEGDLNQVLEVDGELDPSEMTFDLVSEINNEVWGQAFPEPTFVGEFVVKNARLIGNGKHLKLTLEKGKKTFQAVKFRHSEGVPMGKLTAAYKMGINIYNDEATLQLLLEHYEVKPG